MNRFLSIFTPRRGGGFQSLSSGIKHGGQSESLVSNIELTCIVNPVDQPRESEKVPNRSSSAGASSSGSKTNLHRSTEQDDTIIVPPRSFDLPVYRSPSEEIVGFIAGGDHYGQFFTKTPARFPYQIQSDRRMNEREPLGNFSHEQSSLSAENELLEKDELQNEMSFRNANLNCSPFSRQCLLSLVLGTITVTMIFTATITALMLRSHIPGLNSHSHLSTSKLENVNDDAHMLLNMTYPNSDLHSYDVQNETKSGLDLQDLELLIENATDSANHSHNRYRSDVESLDESYDEISASQSALKLLPLVHGNELLILHRKILNETFMKQISDEVRLENANLSPFDTHHSLTKVHNNTEAFIIAEKGFLMEKHYRALVKRLNLTKEEANEGHVSLTNATISQELCAPLPIVLCNASYEFRSYDGSCNNFRNSYWGAANQPFRRNIFPDYDDGVSKPRERTSTGLLLPSAREVSMKVHIDEFREDSEMSLMMRVWSQFVEHDLFNTATSAADENHNCCDDLDKPIVIRDDSQCFSISIPIDDPFYRASSVNLSCMSFIRSAPHFQNCKLGPREQFNQMSSFLDASNIYGSGINTTMELRTGMSGRLRTYHDDRRSFLPLIKDENDTCNRNRQDEVAQGHFCFQAGDSKVNEEATLTSLHTIWVRHHNHLAGTLSISNPDWDDEKLFQETRKIISAQIQHITYTEFLPELLPQDLREKAGLTLLEKGFFQQYDATIDPTISNGFETVFQFSQSLAQGLVKMTDPQGRNESFKQIHSVVMNPFLLWAKGKLGELLRGASTQHAAQMDSYISGQLTHHYHQNSNAKYGLDLAALIIQRGRDHGLPPYVKWRKWCNFPLITSFNELNEVWDEEALRRISSTYGSVADVDLFTGMLAEKPVPGGRVGPTIACILADQFSRIRRGDRFWYEGDIYTGHFKPQQLKQIRATTLARIICDSGEDMKSISVRPLLVPSKSNPTMHCSDIPKVYYTSAWKDKTAQNKAVGKHEEKDAGGRDHYADSSYEDWDTGSLEEYFDSIYRDNQTSLGYLNSTNVTFASGHGSSLSINL